MKWINVKIYVSREGIEPLCGRLYCLGINGVQIEDSEDFAQFVESGQPHWDYIDESLESMYTCPTSVTAYVTDDEAGAQQLSLIREGVEAMRACEPELFADMRIEVTGCDDADWENNWKRYYKPFEIGDRLLVCPEWEERQPKEGQSLLRLNPGHLFGTGTHHSTRMCMEKLLELVGEGDSVLDLGCGSGVLSILSLLIGASQADAVDIDAGAPKVAFENLALNDVDESKYAVYVGDVLDAGCRKNLKNTYDIVVANIVADVIIRLAPAAYELTREGGIFITSGIIDQREDEVRAALHEAGFENIEPTVRGGWVCMVCRK